MALPTNITTGTTGHAGLHNDVNTEVNKLAQDTGWRNVSGLLINGWAPGTFVRLRRVRNKVYFFFRGLDGAGASSTRVMDMPTGFAPSSDIQSDDYRTTDGLRELYFTASSTGGFQTTTGKTFSGASAQLFEYPTDSTFPTTLPGTAV